MEATPQSLNSVKSTRGPPSLLWNVPSLKYPRNELFLTITESITVLRSQTNQLQVLRSFIDGRVELKISLSDYPQVEVEINDYMLSSSFSTSMFPLLPHPLSSNSFYPLDDEISVSFYSSSPSSTVIQSTTPFTLRLDTLHCHNVDTLMSYHITQYPDYLDSLLSCQVTETFTSLHALSCEIKIQSLHLPALRDVILSLPLLTASDFSIARVNLIVKPGNGSARWCAEKDEIEWRISSMLRQREYSISVTFHHHNGDPSNASLLSSPSSLPFSIHFKKCVLSPVHAQFCVLHQLVSNRMKIEKLKLLKISRDYQWRVFSQYRTETNEYQVAVEYRTGSLII
jgi:hypothetical protein